VYVEEATCPDPSATWYVTGVAVPTQSVAGVNVTTPVEVFNVYTPPVTDTVVAVHAEGVWPEEHSFTDGME
jgi:hypothetical protein